MTRVIRHAIALLACVLFLAACIAVPWYVGWPGGWLSILFLVPCSPFVALSAVGAYHELFDALEALEREEP